MKKFLVTAIILIVCVYIILFINTNSITNDFRSVINNEMNAEIAYGELERYKIPDFDDVIYKHTHSKIKRKFVFHNFNKGVMYVKYTYYAYDVNEKLITGSKDVSSKWYIEKRNSRWIVTEIEEKP